MTLVSIPAMPPFAPQSMRELFFLREAWETLYWMS
jgi:hypothetical protein